MTCGEIRKRLDETSTAAAFHFLASDAAVRQHLDGCPACQREFAGEERLWQGLENAARLAERLPEGAVEAVRNRTSGALLWGHQSRRPSGVLPFPQWTSGRRWAWGLGAAAAGVIVLGVVALLLGPHTRHPQVARQAPVPAVRPKPAPAPVATVKPKVPAVRPPDPVEEHYQQEEANLRKLGKWESERILRERVKGAETATSQERWETYRLLKFFADSLAENNPQRSEAMRGRSDILYLEGQVEEAKRVFEEALALLDGRRNKVTAPCETEMRALTLFRRNDPVAAMEYLDLLLTRYPDSTAAARGWFLIGWHYERTGQLEQALKHYRELKKYFADPKWDSCYEQKAWFAESVVLSNMQRQKESVQVLDGLAERFKSQPDWAARALQQSAMTVAPENPAEALARCRKALALVPADSALARELQAYVGRLKGQSLKEFEKAVL